MTFISFKRIKLFKKRVFLSSEKGLPPESRAEIKNYQRPKFAFWRSPFVFLLLIVLIIAYFLTYTPTRSLPLLKPGDIASKDIVSPIDLTIEDTETTQKRQEEAEKAVLPVYTLDLNIYLNTEDKLRMFFSLGRDWAKAPSPTALSAKEFANILAEKTGLELEAQELELWRKTGFTPEMEVGLSDSLRRVFERGILRSKALFFRGEAERGFIISEETKPERLVRIQDVLDLKEARELLLAELGKLSLTSRSRQLLFELGNLLLSPNLNFNRVETDRRREEARARVDTVYYRIKKGKVIIRKGDEATSETVKIIALINQNLELRSSWGRNFLAHFFLFSLLLLSVWFYLKSLYPYNVALNRFLLMGTLLILSLLFNKLALSLAAIFSESARWPFLAEVGSYYFAFPFQVGPLIVAFLTTSHLALIYAILNSLLAGFVLQADFYLMLYAFMGSLAAIYGLKLYGNHNRISTLRAAIMIVTPINIFLALIIYLIRVPSGLSLEPLGMVIMAIIGGFFCGALAFLLLPLFENGFHILTKAKLIELINSDLPIFRQMALEAPGSYHHSLIVSTLAEKAAKDLKLDPLLVKAGALYHDIGKIKRPEYFIENVSRNPNAHEELNPQLSALVIINHVKDGVDLAKKLRLPEKIKEIIAQHHGNSLVRYFYEKAKEKYDPQLHRIGEESYRYPGPRPQSKEAAIIMLADSVEAASRSLSSHDQDTLKRLINDILQSYVEDGQLDECELSLKDLHRIANSFLETLDTIYHPRLKYPSFDFEGLKKRRQRQRKANHGSNNQSTEKT